MRSTHPRMPALLICFVGMTLASAAVAQAPRSSVDIAASTGAPEFRDPKTGQVWTPETVGQDGRPLTGPDDKAFDPQAQSAPAEGRRTARAWQAGRHRAGHGRTDRADRRHGRRLAEGGARPALAGCAVSRQQQRQPGRPRHRVPFYQWRQRRHGHARARPDDGAQCAPGSRDLWPEDGCLRRPRIVSCNGALVVASRAWRGLAQASAVIPSA